MYYEANLRLEHLNQQILRTDVSGMPLEWLTYQQAVKLYFNSQIAYTCGSNIMTIRGGINAKSNLSLIHIYEPTRLRRSSYSGFCL